MSGAEDHCIRVRLIRRFVRSPADPVQQRRRFSAAKCELIVCRASAATDSWLF
jgi:hypothetical protein